MITASRGVRQISLRNANQDINKVRDAWPINHKYVFLRKEKNDSLVFFGAIALSGVILFSVGRGFYRCLANVKE